MPGGPGHRVRGAQGRIRPGLPGPTGLSSKSGLRLSTPNRLPTCAWSEQRFSPRRGTATGSSARYAARRRRGGPSASGTAGGGSPRRSKPRVCLDAWLLVCRRWRRVGLGRRPLCDSAASPCHLGRRWLGQAWSRLRLGRRTLALSRPQPCASWSVAQTSGLLYRRLVVGRRAKWGNVETCHTQGKSGKSRLARKELDVSSQQDNVDSSDHTWKHGGPDTRG